MGLALEVDEVALADALAAGGMSPEAQLQCPTIIMPGPESAQHVGGQFVPQSEYNDGAPAIHLFTSTARPQVLDTVAAHEAVHASAFINEDEYMSAKAVGVRKMVASGVALLAMGAIDFAMRQKGADLTQEITTTVFAGPPFLNFCLYREYVQRPDERLAFAAEDHMTGKAVFEIPAGDGHLPDGQPSFWESVKKALKWYFMPDYMH